MLRHASIFYRLNRGSSNDKNLVGRSILNYKVKILNQVKMGEISIIIKFLCFFAICIGFLNCEEEYDSRYDNINIDEILESDRLLSNYIGCLMNEKPCTEDGALLKSKISFLMTIIKYSYLINIL